MYVCLYKCTNEIDVLSTNSIPTWGQQILRLWLCECESFDRKTTHLAVNLTTYNIFLNFVMEAVVCTWWETSDYLAYLIKLTKIRKCDKDVRPK